MAHLDTVSGPFTPQKKDDPVNGFAMSLNATWNLELPIKTSEYSPSKRIDPTSKEERVFGLIKYMYYKYPTALHNALAEFEDEATRLNTKWKGQQNGVQRPSKRAISSHFSQRKDSFIKEKNIVDTSALANVLLEVLSKAKLACLEKGPPIHVPSVPVHTPHTQAIPNSEHASPFDCSIDDATLALLDGEDKETALVDEDSQEIFTTPRSSPTHSPLSSPVLTAKDLNPTFKKPNMFVGQKRPLQEPARRVLTPKVSRGGENHVSPCQSFCGAQPESPLGRSFPSSASSSFVASFESTQRVIDTAATSFMSNAGSTQANKQLQREAADANIRNTSTLSLDSHSFFQVPEPLPDLLLRESPFTPERSPMFCKASFRQSYEIGRVALHCKTPTKDIPSELVTPIMDYSSLWSYFKGLGTLPGKSKPVAWKRAEMTWTGVSLSGELTFIRGKGGPVFSFQLNPLKMEKSYRLSRQFGGDRFLVIDLPSLQERDLPEYLKMKKRPDAVRKDILDWIVYTGHHILGRTWHAFLVKSLDSSKSQKMRRTEVDPGTYRIFLFATDGPDFVTKQDYRPDKPYHPAMSIQELIDWFMPAKHNEDQLALKLFARLTLGLLQSLMLEHYAC